MRSRVGIGHILVISAATLFAIQFGEFLMLGYVWLFATNAKPVSPSESAAIAAATVVTIVVTFLACAVSTISIALRRAWPSNGAFIGVGWTVALTQGVFLCLGCINFTSPWVLDFFASKTLSFALGLLSGLALLLVARIQPWKKLA